MTQSMSSSCSNWQRTPASFNEMIIRLEVFKPRMKAWNVLFMLFRLEQLLSYCCIGAQCPTPWRHGDLLEIFEARSFPGEGGKLGGLWKLQPLE